MHETLEPPASPPIPATIAEEDIEELDILRRSPHPYHRQKSDLLEPSDRLVYRPTGIAGRGSSASIFTKDSTPASDSGTEADDEHILKGLPAPKGRLHKGLRGMNEELLSGTSTPVVSPAVLEEMDAGLRRKSRDDKQYKDKQAKGPRSRRRKELARRSAEVLLLTCLGELVRSSQHVRPLVASWRRELGAQVVILIGLLAVYPLRLVIWAYTQRKPSKTIPISIPSAFDPAPILYPQLIPIFVSLLVAVNVEGVILPNLVLSLCTVPGALIPTTRYTGPGNPVHWLVTCIPLFVRDLSAPSPEGRNVPLQGLPTETLVLLYPLHQNLCVVLQYLTTTSLLTAELQLLSTGLINILLLSYSPQAEILKALLWVGGLSTLILCCSVIRWNIALARVPKWRFSRVPAPPRGFVISRLMRSILLLARRPRHDLVGSDLEESTAESGNSSDEDYGLGLARATSLTVERAGSVADADSMTVHISRDVPAVQRNAQDEHILHRPPSRRHTLPSLRPDLRPRTHTPSGRRKRSASSTVQSFFCLTQAQATTRKWIYACFVYLSILATILVGVRLYVQRFALDDAEPVGWALGYLFGDIPRFRFQVVHANLERWILLPPRSSPDSDALCHLGRIAHLRHTFLGEANTRLALASYFLLVLATGLAVVFRLSPICEVDTRRKVFHFMMVAMFLPATFVDPAFCALGLSVVLAVFLLLDLLRASQLPPLSKPIARFLTPYVDGRDLRGPVVVSHIFLLIGCAIPLWLSLAAVPRTGEGVLRGWEVPTRDVSMVSGVVCVGLGDAAASLIGRRWGRRKWLWGGGKSLEGSVAFALAVFGGLMTANAWLRAGGWPTSGAGPLEAGGWWSAIRKTGLCASVASLTEAVLTGGNDNVVVPVVLWTCVKSTGI